jgi:hypothetical protein
VHRKPLLHGVALRGTVLRCTDTTSLCTINRSKATTAGSSSSGSNAVDNDAMLFREADDEEADATNVFDSDSEKDDGNDGTSTAAKDEVHYCA